MSTIAGGKTTARDITDDDIRAEVLYGLIWLSEHHVERKTMLRYPFAGPVAQNSVPSESEGGEGDDNTPPATPTKAHQEMSLPEFLGNCWP
jgi:hypothetical protein